MMTSYHENDSCITGPMWREFTGDWKFDVSVVASLNKLLNKQLSLRRFKTYAMTVIYMTSL